MIGTSLAEDGDEFLGQRRGLAAYLSDAKTFGIPLLYPWANRLSDNVYEADGAVVTLTPGSNGVRTDPGGSPMHGVLAASPDWQVTLVGNALTAVLDFSAPRLLASFPFPHLLTQRVTLADRTLTVETTVEPTSASAPVPLCFGYHPYVTIPGVPRAQWSLTTPDMRHLPVDDRGLPTGAHEPWTGRTEVLDTTSYDDGFDEVADGAVFVVEGGDRRIEVTFETGYPAAQLFAPPSDDLIAIEPMTAPTDALRRGGYRVAAGEPATSRFSISVT